MITEQNGVTRINADPIVEPEAPIVEEPQELIATEEEPVVEEVVTQAISTPEPVDTTVRKSHQATQEYSINAVESMETGDPQPCVGLLADVHGRMYGFSSGFICGT